MLVFWLMYLVPAIAALTFGNGIRKQSEPFSWYCIGFIYIWLIGFRYQVGGDWGSYINHYLDVIGIPLNEAIVGTDPGYAALNWIMAISSLEIFGVNTVCGAIFITGLCTLCRQQPNPWLGFAVAVPYLLVVVAMGYSRQGVALGFIFWALASLESGKFQRYLFFIICATLFHRTSVLMVPLGIFLYGKGWFLRLVAVVLASYGIWDALLAEEQERLWTSYVDEQMQSEGARVRVFMNLVPSLCLLIYWKQWKQRFPNPWIWFWMAVCSIVNVGLVDLASTAVDRIALYFTPIQVAVYSRLPYLARNQVSPQTMTLVILLGYAAVLFVWLNYATHALYWLPYQNLLFQ